MGVAALWLGAGLASGQPSIKGVDPDLPDRASYVEFEVGSWRFMPAVSSDRGVIEGFVATYTAKAPAANSITTLWLESTDDGWDAFAFEDNDPASAAAHAVLTRGDSSLFVEHPVLGAATAHKLRNGPVPDAEPVRHGAHQFGPWGELLAVTPDTRPALTLMRRLGVATVPDLPEMAAAVNTTTTDADVREASLIAPACPIVIAAEATTVDAAVSVTDANDGQVASEVVGSLGSGEQQAFGLMILLDVLRMDAESRIFAHTPRSEEVSQVVGFFCAGCTTTYGPCVGAGAWTGVGVSTIGGTNCSYSRPGTKTWTRTGLTFWCCNSCAATGTTPCTEVNGCFVPTGTPCPAAPGGPGCL